MLEWLRLQCVSKLRVSEHCSQYITSLNTRKPLVWHRYVQANLLPWPRLSHKRSASALKLWMLAFMNGISALFKKIRQTLGSNLTGISLGPIWVCHAILVDLDLLNLECFGNWRVATKCRIAEMRKNWLPFHSCKLQDDFETDPPSLIVMKLLILFKVVVFLSRTSPQMTLDGIRLWLVTSQQTLDTFLVFNFDKRLGCPHFLHVFSHQYLNTLNPTLSYIRQFHGAQRVHRSERCTRHGFEELWAPWCCWILKSRSNEYLFAEEGDFSGIGGSNFGWGSTSLWYWFSKAHSIHIVCFLEVRPSCSMFNIWRQSIG